eukprot:gene4674-6566_t
MRQGFGTSMVENIQIDSDSLTNFEHHPMTYFQKPVIGSSQIQSSQSPIQLVFPSGGFGLGIPVKSATINTNNNSSIIQLNNAVIISGPESHGIDEKEKKALKVAFLILLAVNFILTCILYAKANIIDTTKVSPPIIENYYSSLLFTRVPQHRRHIENISFSFTIITMFIGALSVLKDSHIGLSIYAISIILNFFLGTSSLPYFIYSVRYIFDVGTLYLALVYRSRLVFTILPLHSHRR